MEQKTLFEKTRRLELLFLTLPFVVFLIGIGCYEIQTGFIPNAVLLYASLYFFIAACATGLKPWWNYLLGAIILFLAFLLISVNYEMIFKEDLLGGGTIKLAAVVGVALGMPMALLVGLFFFTFQIAAHFITPFFSEIKILPSVPIILLSVGGGFLLTRLFKKKELRPKLSNSLSNELQSVSRGKEKKGNNSKLWKIGLIVFVSGVLVNSLFVRAGVGGLLRELMRLSIILGLILLVIGLIRRK